MQIESGSSVPLENAQPAAGTVGFSRRRGRNNRIYQPNLPILGEVRDVDGVLWDIRDVRATRHGFDLFFGTPAKDRGAYRGGLPGLILTEPLEDFWRTNRTSSQGFIFDLPAGRTTLKRARKTLGFHWHRLRRLTSMLDTPFPSKYGVHTSAGSGLRNQNRGERARELGWWRNSETCRQLLSGRTLGEIGQDLGLSIAQTKRLQDQAKQESTQFRKAK